MGYVMNYDKRSFEIVLCPKCQGEGILKHEVMIDYHKREYDVEISECSGCDGKGRLRKEVKIVYSKL